MSLILFVLTGWILRQNPEWFNGAEQVGTIMFYGGLCVFVIEFLIILVTLGVIGSSERRHRKRRHGIFR
jgi:hypothetical protein